MGNKVGFNNRIEYKEGDILGSSKFIEELEIHIQPNGDRVRMAKFECKCGSIFTARIAAVKGGYIVSCGCVRNEKVSKFNRENFTIHGNWEHSLCQIWYNMKYRCYNPDNISYPRYGGRGIKICDRWLENLNNFIEDMGSTYKKGLSLERLDVDGNYELSNCTWATPKEQAINRRSTVFIDYNGEKLCTKDYCDKIGISYRLFHSRIQYGWSIERASKPEKYKRIKKELEHG